MRQAAAKGIHEARRWLETGEPPREPAFVAHPPFNPPEGWYRLALEAIGVKWLQIQSDLTPHGHHGLLRWRDPSTHRIVGGPGGRQAGGPTGVGAPKSDEVITDEKADKEHKFGSAMFELKDATFPHDQSSPLPALTQLAAEIPHTHLADEGREQNYHITALYGFHPEVTAVQIEEIADGFGTIKVKLGKVSLFQNEDDVLKVDVVSPDLERLNEALGKLPHTDTHGEFKPHMTVAYLRKGFGAPFVGSNAVEGKELRFARLVFSDVEKKRTEIEL